MLFGKVPSPVSGFFLRVLAALLVVNLGTAGVLLYIAYTFSSQSLTKQAQETITQQVTVFAEAMSEDRLLRIQKTIKALESSQDMGDFLYGSEAERLILSRRIERRFIQEQRDNSDIIGLYFYDDIGHIQIGVKNKQRLLLADQVLDEEETPIQQSAKLLFSQMQDTLLLVSSGNMEWFIPPIDAVVSGPFTRSDSGYTMLVGLAKLDISSGLFGGMLLLHFSLDNWLSDLARIKIQDNSIVWVFNDDGQVLLKPESGIKLSESFDPTGLIPGQKSRDTSLIETDKGLVAYRDISLLDSQKSLRLVFAVPNQLLLQDLEPAIQFFSGVLIVSVILLIIVSYFISSFLVRPFVELAVARNKLLTAQRLAKLGHWEWDRESEFIRLSENAKEILSIRLPPDKNSIDLERLLSITHIEDRQSLDEKFQQAIQGNKSVSFETRFIMPNGHERFIHQSIDVIDEDQPRIIGTVQDISERRQAEARIRELAYQDSVTGLANRRMLDEVARSALISAKFLNKRLALIFLDLDQFKRINDTLGHEAGDELLRGVANRLKEIVRPSDTVSVMPPETTREMSVARLGGDEFIVLLPDIEEEKDALVVADRIHNALNQPFQIYGKQILSGGSLGISIYPEHGGSIGELLRHADAAMYHAKALGRNRYVLYSPDIDDLQKNRFSMEIALHRALKNHEFELFYQPRFDIEGLHIKSFEALIRWNDPEKGLVMPNDFIYIAEENGFIIPLGQWIMKAACQQLTIWQKTFGPELCISINLSPAQFLSEELVSGTSKIIADSHISPESVELELTENALFADIESGVEIANELKQLGLKLSIDDFGTGYSSLRLLRRLPVDTLKIDQSFVRDMLKDRDDAMIVQSFIMLGHNLGLKIVAEGVEEKGQWMALQELECDELQGYYFGKPCPADKATELLEKYNQQRIVPQERVNKP